MISSMMMTMKEDWQLVFHCYVPQEAFRYPPDSGGMGREHEGSSIPPPSCSVRPIQYFHLEEMSSYVSVTEHGASIILGLLLKLEAKCVLFPNVYRPTKSPDLVESTVHLGKLLHKKMQERKCMCYRRLQCSSRQPSVQCVAGGLRGSPLASCWRCLASE